MTHSQILKPVRSSAVRGAITTLKRAGFIPPERVVINEDRALIQLNLPTDVIQPKKKLKKSKIKTT